MPPGRLCGACWHANRSNRQNTASEVLTGTLPCFVNLSPDPAPGNVRPKRAKLYQPALS